MKTILVPVDFSGPTPSVVRLAVSLARASAARILLVHVITIPPNYLVYPRFDGAPPPDEVIAQARAQLNTWLATVRQEGIAVNGKLLCGHASDQITAYATEESADLLVMGSHGHSALFDLVLGSTSGEVLRHAPCPVVILPPRAVDESGTHFQSVSEASASREAKAH